MADTTAPKSFDWLAQILFGRYRKWEDLTYEHLIIITVLVFFMINIYIWLLRWRFKNYARRLAQVPRKVIPAERKDMPTALYKALVDEYLRVDKIQQSKLIPEPGRPQDGDPGWGGLRTNVEGVNFKTYIARSFLVLEQTALARRPGMYQTIDGLLGCGVNCDG